MLDKLYIVHPGSQSYALSDWAQALSVGDVAETGAEGTPPDWL